MHDPRLSLHFSGAVSLTTHVHVTDAYCVSMDFISLLTYDIPQHVSVHIHPQLNTSLEFGDLLTQQAEGGVSTAVVPEEAVPLYCTSTAELGVAPAGLGAAADDGGSAQQRSRHQSTAGDAPDGHGNVDIGGGIGRTTVPGQSSPTSRRPRVACGPSSRQDVPTSMATQQQHSPDTFQPCETTSSVDSKGLADCLGLNQQQQAQHTADSGVNSAAIGILQDICSKNRLSNRPAIDQQPILHSFGPEQQRSVIPPATQGAGCSDWRGALSDSERAGRPTSVAFIRLGVASNAGTTAGLVASSKSSVAVSRVDGAANAGRTAAAAAASKPGIAAVYQITDPSIAASQEQVAPHTVSESVHKVAPSTSADVDRKRPNDEAAVDPIRQDASRTLLSKAGKKRKRKAAEAAGSIQQQPNAAFGGSTQSQDIAASTSSVMKGAGSAAAAGASGNRALDIIAGAAPVTTSERSGQWEDWLSGSQPDQPKASGLSLGPGLTLESAGPLASQDSKHRGKKPNGKRQKAGQLQPPSKKHAPADKPIGGSNKATTYPQAAGHASSKQAATFTGTDFAGGTGGDRGKRRKNDPKPKSATDDIFKLLMGL